MREELISFETAKLAKEKGFKQIDVYPCFGDDGNVHTVEYFNTSYPTKNSYYQSTQSLLQKFLREEKGISVDVFSALKEKKVFQFGCDMIAFFKLSDEWHSFNLNKFFDTYEEALEAGLKKALELIK